ncbi:MAG: phytanoyl-CoA dioxygenase family protein [Bacteroidetes Order II. Incertae sedis bacterium]|nr:phytanoyl-CoA dioxygenase family protein [Bacteroidetes Order II. bacterium]
MNTLKQPYENDGYLIFRNALSESLAQETCDHVFWLLDRYPGTRPEQLHHNMLVNDPFIWRLAGDERLLDIAAQFIGDEVALFAAHYIAKAPKTGQKVLWHQDGSYWPLEPMEVVTLWLAATPSTPENGCMRIIPGTHHDKLVSWEELRKHDDGDNVLGSGLDPQSIDESQAIDLVLQPGDVSVHNPNIIHGSEPNHSDQWRIGLTLRYIPVTTKILNPDHHAILFRGKAVRGVNTYIPRPRYDPKIHFPFAGSHSF